MCDEWEKLTSKPHAMHVSYATLDRTLRNKLPPCTALSIIRQNDRALVCCACTESYLQTLQALMRLKPNTPLFSPGSLSRSSCSATLAHRPTKHALDWRCVSHPAR
eukprot:379913-Pelagomonas_calceolata.AAC.3